MSVNHSGAVWLFHHPIRVEEVWPVCFSACEGGVACVPGNHGGEGLACVFQSKLSGCGMCLSILVEVVLLVHLPIRAEEAWLMCLSVTVEEVWPDEVGVASVSIK